MSDIWAHKTMDKIELNVNEENEMSKKRFGT